MPFWVSGWANAAAWRTGARRTGTGRRKPRHALRRTPLAPARCERPDSVRGQSNGPSLTRASLFDVADELADTPAERAALRRLLRDMDTPGPSTGGRRAKRARTVRAQGLEDINFFNPLTRLVTSLFLKDVRDFFFDKPRRERMKARLQKCWPRATVRSCSSLTVLGSVIAYSLLLDLDRQFNISQLVTMGLPRNRRSQDQLRKLHKLPKGPPPVPPAWDVAQRVRSARCGRTEGKAGGAIPRAASPSTTAPWTTRTGRWMRIPPRDTCVYRTCSAWCVNGSISSDSSASRHSCSRPTPSETSSEPPG